MNSSAAFADWVRTALDMYEQPLVRYARRLTGNLESAQEVVQETFLRLCAQDAAELEGRLAEWLFTVCRNKALDIRRKEKRMTSLEIVTVEPHESEDSPSRQAELRDSAGWVLRLLDQLPSNQQEVIRLKFQDSLSYREISGITGLSVSNVGFLIHIGLKTLRQKTRIAERSA